MTAVKRGRARRCLDVSVLREIDASGKMRYVPLLALGWMGIDLRETEWRGGYGWERGRGDWR